MTITIAEKAYANCKLLDRLEGKLYFQIVLQTIRGIAYTKEIAIEELDYFITIEGNITQALQKQLTPKQWYSAKKFPAQILSLRHKKALE